MLESEHLFSVCLEEHRVHIFVINFYLYLLGSILRFLVKVFFHFNLFIDIIHY